MGIVPTGAELAADSRTRARWGGCPGNARAHCTDDLRAGFRSQPNGPTYWLANVLLLGYILLMGIFSKKTKADADDTPTTVLPRVKGNTVGKAPARIETCACGGKLGIMCKCAGTGTRTEWR